MTINSTDITVASSALGLLAITFVGKRAGWFKIIGGTNALLREQNSILTEQNTTLKDTLKTTTAKFDIEKKEWSARHEENIRELSQMKGQIDVLKSIPLVNIDSTLNQIAEFNESLSISNKRVVQLLENKADIDAEDRGVLTNQNKHIATEVRKAMKGGTS